MASAASKVYDLIKDTVESCGVELWDVRFLKEGASWYLRVYIDSENGISIDNCTDVSHAIDPIIDEADPIDKSYYLEVCSPGIEREITRDEHYTKLIGKKIKIKLYKAIDSVKEFSGVLTSFDGEEVILNTEKGEMKFSKKDISKANVLFE